MYSVQYTVHMDRAPAPSEPSKLSRDRIVEVGFGLLERDGWEALSMRRLAQELDVWPMAVYRYFRDKDELVDALVGHAIGAIDVPGGQGPWRAQMRELCGAARSTLARLPPELGARLAPALFTPGRSGLTDAGLEILGSAGFRADQARRAWAALGAYTAGFAELAPEGGAAEFDYGLDRLMDGLEQRSPKRKRATTSRRAGPVHG
jgi:AcrR family transcriptional regulator